MADDSTRDARTDEQVAVALRAAWATLARDLALDPVAAADLGADLLARWQEPHRRYHSIHHLAAVLRTLDDLSPDDGAPAEVRAAAWFHDAVYEGVAGDDEERSAALAEATLPQAGLDRPTARRIADMVRSTAGHIDPSTSTPVDDPTALLLDADLAILAAPRPLYDAYVAGVRAEHPEIDDAAFASGRGRVLDTLLGRAVLFHTAVGRERFEAAARANLSRERRDLAAPADRTDEAG